jgi:hypothetical protein
MQTGDFVLGTNLPYVGELLDQGVKVALVYGDKDYQCNCTCHSRSIITCHVSSH